MTEWIWQIYLMVIGKSHYNICGGGGGGDVLSANTEYSYFLNNAPFSTACQPEW